MGDCFINGRFHVNNLDLVQRVGEWVAGRLLTEDFEWKGTLLAGSPIKGEPAVAVMIYGSVEDESPFSQRTVVVGDSVYYYPLVISANGLLPSIYSLRFFPSPYTEIFFISPDRFFIMSGNKVYLLNSVYSEGLTNYSFVFDSGEL